MTATGVYKQNGNEYFASGRGEEGELTPPVML